MKSTGIVRRIDGLGRVVLPKEIRKTLKLNSGDLLQIFVEKEVIILEKYSPISTYDKTIDAVAECLFQTANLPVVITDNQSVVQAKGTAQRLKGEKLSQTLIEIIENKSSYIINSSDGGVIKKITQAGNEEEFLSQIIVTVIGVENQPLGAVILLDTKVGGQMGLKEVSLVNLASKMLTMKLDS